MTVTNQSLHLRCIFEIFSIQIYHANDYCADDSIKIYHANTRYDLRMCVIHDNVNEIWFCPDRREAIEYAGEHTGAGEAVWLRGEHPGNVPSDILLLPAAQITWRQAGGPSKLPSAGRALFIFNLWATFLHLNMIVHCLMTVKTADIVITTYE